MLATDWPERRHGDDGVPEGGRDALEGGSRHVLLGVEHDGGEDDDCHREREDEEAQFAGTALQCAAEDAQPGRMPRKLENTKRTHIS